MVGYAGTHTTSQSSPRSESSQTGRRLGLGKSRNRSAWYSGNWFAVLGATRRFRPGKGRDRGAGDRRDRSTDLAASRRLRFGKRWNGSAGNGRDGLPEGGAGDHFDCPSWISWCGFRWFLWTVVVFKLRLDKKVLVFGFGDQKSRKIFMLLAHRSCSLTSARSYRDIGQSWLELTI